MCFSYWLQTVQIFCCREAVDAAKAVISKLKLKKFIPVENATLQTCYRSAGAQPLVTPYTKIVFFCRLEDLNTRTFCHATFILGHPDLGLLRFNFLSYMFLEEIKLPKIKIWICSWKKVLVLISSFLQKKICVRSRFNVLYLESYIWQQSARISRLCPSFYPYLITSSRP